MAINSQGTPKLQTSMVEIIAIALVIVLVFWFFVRPKMAQLSDARTQVKAQEMAFRQVEADSAELTRLLSKLQQSQDEVALIDEALPLESRVTRLHLLLDSLVKASGTKLSALNVQVGELLAAGDKTEVANKFGVTRKLQTFTGDVTVTGSIDEFKNLLQLIETNGRIIEITNMDLSSEGGVSSFRLKLKAYSYDQ